MTEKRFALSRLIPFLCLLLLPLGAIALGIMLLTVNTLFNVAFAVTFGVLPLCFVLLLWPIWMTRKPKAWLRVLLCPWCFCFRFCSCWPWESMKCWTAMREMK